MLITPFLRATEIGGSINTIYADPERTGVAWFGTSEAILRYDLNVKKDYTVDFSCPVRRVVAGGDSVIYGGTALFGNMTPPTLDYANNALRFEYAATSFNDPAQTQYQTLLDGFDNGWSRWTADTQKDYTNLPEGDYRFRVRAKNVHQHFSSEGEYLFAILPPWYRSIWAYTGSVIFAIIAVFSLVRWRVRRVEAHARRLEGIIAERTTELAEKNEKLQELDTLKSRFFANISHEFRTPLTLILGEIKNVLPEQEKQNNKNKLSRALRSAGQMQRLINQLLDLSKFDAGQMTLKASEQNIVPLLKLLTGSFESLAKQKLITLSFESVEEDISVFFEQDKIDKVINNLLSNAIKFTPAGGTILVKVEFGDTLPVASQEVAEGNIAVEDAAGGEKSEVKISVRDSGIGIAKDRLPHIFDRFYQVDSTTTRAYQGTGIGLALTKELVQFHGGGISVESREGFGTTFIVTLPLGKAHLKPEQIAEDIADSGMRISNYSIADSGMRISNYSIADFGMQPATTGIADLNKQNKSEIPQSKIVLIVEDNPDMLAYIRESLEEDYHILEAKDGEEGFSQAQEYIPDIVITDVMMPKVDGYELIHKIRLDMATSHIPIIMLTAKAAEEDKFEGLEKGVDAYLTKPFNKKELRIRTRKLIELRRQLRQQAGIKAVLAPSEIEASSMEQQFLEKVKKVIEKNKEEEDFSVDELATKIGVVKRQLQRKLKALTDASPQRCIRTLRLERARQQLEQNAGTVSEICYQVGYGNVSAFSRAFREEFGQAPSAVKK